MEATLDTQELETKVKDMYRHVAEQPHGKYHFELGRPLAEHLGYPADILDRVPDGACESFAGVGYFFDLAEPAEGERVIDLGSGSGMDVFFAAEQVGPSGAVAGVDFTSEQLAKARRNREGVRLFPGRVPRRAHRAAAGRGGELRLRDLERGDQPRARQGSRLRRGGPSAEAGRSVGDSGRGRDILPTPSPVQLRRPLRPASCLDCLAGRRRPSVYHGISSRHVMRAQVNKRRFNTSLKLPSALKPEVPG